MRLGIYGGTFDPIHNGHIAVAKGVKRELGLDKVFFVVAADPPHKQGHERTDAETRLQMTEATLMPLIGLSASDAELERGGISYTVETLEAFKSGNPNIELYFIVGADMLANFSNWYMPKRILELASLVAVQREGQQEQLEPLAADIEKRFGGRVIVSSVVGPDISSTQVRKRVYDALPIDKLVPIETELFIYEKLLYAPPELLPVRQKLASVLDYSRFKHTMLTAREAILLAHHHGMDTKKARLCAMLHDCAKLKGSMLDDCMKKHGFVPNDDERENQYAIHSRLGAVVARDDYGITDPEILTAIERHTLGCPDMTPFDEVIFLADKLEPTREYRRISHIRELAFESLDAAVAAVIKNNISYNKSRGKALHPTTGETLAAIESRIK